MKFGSLFAGAGGFDLGLEAAGWQCGWQVEWDEHCQQTLAHHWPQVPRWGDVSIVNGAELPPVDVITFGSPCQDLSIAGRRAGLEGERSGLFFEATRIIKEMQHATGGTFPRYAIWENVVGALHSRNGDDFEAVLQEMADLGGHHLEWAVLDAQFFGIPQRRRRVFVIACLDPATAGRRGTPILSLREGGKRDSSASRSPKQSAPTNAANSFGAARSADVEAFRMLAFGHYTDDDTASALKRRDYKDATDLVVHHDPIFTFDTQFGSNANVFTDQSPTLKASQQPPSIAGRRVPNVRRLTPVECERLMGWPDNHTLHRADGKLNTESTRYKMCGNGVASPVAQWIAQQIGQVESGL